MCVLKSHDVHQNEQGSAIPDCLVCNVLFLFKRDMAHALFFVRVIGSEV